MLKVLLFVFFGVDLMNRKKKVINKESWIIMDIVSMDVWTGTNWENPYDENHKPREKIDVLIFNNSEQAQNEYDAFPNSQKKLCAEIVKIENGKYIEMEE